MGLRALGTFLRVLWLLAGRRAGSSDRRRRGVAPPISRRWRWCLWPAWGRDSNPAGFSGFAFPPGWDTRAGLASVVGWRLWLSRGEAVAEQGWGCGL